jgi:hypothetical protein
MDHCSSLVGTTSSRRVLTSQNCFVVAIKFHLHRPYAPRVCFLTMSNERDQLDEIFSVVAHHSDGPDRLSSKEGRSKSSVCITPDAARLLHAPSAKFIRKQWREFPPASKPAPSILTPPISRIQAPRRAVRRSPGRSQRRSASRRSASRSVAPGGGGEPPSSPEDPPLALVHLDPSPRPRSRSLSTEGAVVSFFD